jgi:monoamine oxidase
MAMNRREFLRLAGLAAGEICLYRELNWALPQQKAVRNGNGRRVVVLGAGLAGLAAGQELQRAGHQVTILEAQLHPGGRVHTIREGLSDDLYAEAGAGRIPDTHNVTLEWVKYFGLELEPFYPKNLAEVFLLKGKRVQRPMGKPVDMSQVPLELTPAERKIGLSHFDEYYYGPTMRKIGDAIRDEWPPEIARLADISLADFLRQKGASEDAIHFMSLGFETAAALDFLRDANSHHTESLFKIKGGNDQLPRAFAAKLSDVIHYGCAVEHIERGEDHVRTTCRHAGMQDQVEADAVVCTIPFSVVRNIAVTPDWSPNKRKVINNVYYSPVVRATYQTSHRYWEDQGLNGFGLSDKNLEVWHPTLGKPGSRGLLQASVYEDFAHVLDQLHETERTERMIADMDELHPGLRPYLEGVVVKSWANDPWQRGAFTTFLPGQQQWYEDICRREGRIWFAGEHTSPWPGWMQGAIAAGIKAAREISVQA